MSLIFEPITLDKQKEYSEYFSMCSQKTSDYTHRTQRQTFL